MTQFALVAPSQAQRRSMVSDADALSMAEAVASSGRIELMQFGIQADPALAALADKALQKMEHVLGRTFDTGTYGEKIKLVVTSHTPVSHVWRGYDHQSDPRAIVFLNPVAARMAISGRNATFAHEIAHLLTWRFASHTLREGLADYLALQVLPNAGVGPNVNGYVPAPPIPDGLLRYLGGTQAAPLEVQNDPAFRRAYYYASYRLVNGLIERKGFKTFLELYDARDPEPEYARLYGSARTSLIAELFK